MKKGNTLESYKEYLKETYGYIGESFYEVVTKKAMIK